MNRQEYNRMIEETLKTNPLQTENSLETARAVFNNMGISLPKGDLRQVSDALATDDYMGWRKCTVKEAQEYANNGTAVVGVSDDQIAVVAANEGQGAVTSSAVMTLDENTSALAVADTAFYASRAGSTTGCREPVTIWYDGNLKVRFHSSGKVWHYIGCDQIFDVVTSLPYLTKKNYFVDGDFGPVQDYSIQELKLLYAIDPYGVAAYIKRFAENAIVDTSLAGIIAYKNLMFRVLFGREPKYFARDINGEWYRTQDIEELEHVISESELYFGTHALWDWVTKRHIIEFVISVGNIAAQIVCPKLMQAIDTIKEIYDVSVLICSVGTEELNNEIFAYVSNTTISEALEELKMDWVMKVVTIAGNIDDITNSLSNTLDLNKRIVEYCVAQNDFSITILNTNNQTYSLQYIVNNL